ncbi:methyltransferase domain-containing protein [Flavisphingomonas formosensis]|uniref:methyltransferase domain-containing protein n=1 Tax=Flavisphingomonas formosensis TaxID=861534 RepID=UPI0012FACE20|nr:methyltransferase domain-containing protein [Sphingomonas formosensis]
MIVPAAPQHAPDVADHYDELDPVYRQLWGEHVHHGYWASGRETPQQAVEALSDLVGERLGIASRAALVDIGCGYGATARRFAALRGAEVTGLTLSAAQAAAAPPCPGVTLLVRDWLASGLPADSFDGAYAIESSEHMVDKPAFFHEAARVLKPGGRLVVCAWLAAPDPQPWEVRHLLEPICREGRLPSMGTAADYEGWAAQAGLLSLSATDISHRVRRTWTICALRFLGAMIVDRRIRRLSLAARNRLFALSVPRLILAYRTGAMRYGVFTWEKPAGASGAPNPPVNRLTSS